MKRQERLRAQEEQTRAEAEAAKLKREEAKAREEERSRQLKYREQLERQMRERPAKGSEVVMSPTEAKVRVAVRARTSGSSGTAH